MPDFQEHIGLAAARAKRQFPDHQIMSVYPVCWPVYRLRLSLVVLARQELSAIAGTVLQLVNLGIVEPAEVSRHMGLNDRYMAAGAAELLQAGLLAQKADRSLEITSHGKQALHNGGESRRPQRKALLVPYDSLTRRVLDTDVDELRDRDYVGKNGLFVLPSDGRKPRLSELRLGQVQDYVKQDLEDGEEVLDIAEVRDRDSVLRYRDGYVVAKMATPNLDQPVFAVYRAQQYLEDETTALARLADVGHNLVPEEYEAIDDAAPWTSSPTVSPQEAEHLAAIAELDQALGEARDAVSEVNATDSEIIGDDEREALLHSNRLLEDRVLELSRDVENRESQLQALSQGATRVIRSGQHRDLLLKAIDTATSDLVLVSAWIRPEAFDGEVRGKLARAITRGVTVRIAWGLGTDTGGRMPAQRREAARRNFRVGEDTIGLLRNMVREPDGRDRLVVQRIETHQKFIICDDKFCAVGSFNWLSYRGEGPRHESSHYSERAEDIEQWKNEADRLFGHDN